MAESSMAGSSMAWSWAARSLEAESWAHWIRPAPGQPSSSRRTIPCYRGTVRESGRAAIRWCVPAPQSASSSGRRRSGTERSITVPSRVSWPRRGRPSLMRQVRIPSQTKSSSGTPILPRTSGHLTNCILGANGNDPAKRMI